MAQDLGRMSQGFKPDLSKTGNETTGEKSIKLNPELVKVEGQDVGAMLMGQN